jgi:hypothetical protein
MSLFKSRDKRVSVLTLLFSLALFSISIKYSETCFMADRNDRPLEHDHRGKVGEAPGTVPGLRWGLTRDDVSIFYKRERVGRKIFGVSSV